MDNLVGADVTQIQNNTLNENIIEEITIADILDFWEFGKIICIVGFIIIIICLFVMYKKKINKRTKNEFQNNIRSKKFVENLYVEIGNTNDYIRYFIFEKKWYKRIIYSLKYLYSNHIKKLIENVYGKSSKYFGNKKIKKEIERNISIFRDIRQDRRREPKYHNERWYLEQNSYCYKYLLEDLNDKFNLCNSKIALILGKAGSGKTNLATNIAKNLIEKYKKICIYFNAKDVNEGNIENKFKSFFYTDLLITAEREYLIYLYLKILHFLNIKIYIIIEALNENENKEFINRLVNFINKYSKYRNIRFILTSRIEFFEIKYKNVLDEYLTKPYSIVMVEELKMNENAIKRVIEKYKKYYDFNGTYNKRVASIIEESPIIIRIFFETYKNSNKDINDINKYKLFNEYINYINMANPGVDVEEILENIAQVMLKNNRFDYIEISQIKTSKELINKLIYENVILNKSIIQNQDSILEEQKNIIMFTFDEIRDFIIAKVIIKDNTKECIYKIIENLIESNNTISEGVIRNIYLYYKISDDSDACDKILKSGISNIHNFKYKYDGEVFFNFGLDLIFSINKELFDCELEYLNNTDMIGQDVFRILFILLRNTVEKEKNSIEIIEREIEKLTKNPDEKSFLENMDYKDYREINSDLAKSNKLEEQKLYNLIDRLIPILIKKEECKYDKEKH